ncbi:MAG: DUF1028 domain-containing protein [Candidatus Zixiibacteriota bacterium]|nr:MAG: DUF1028 domain-containing protein [candidate division Zixibacteria bacterium]
MRTCALISCVVVLAAGVALAANPSTAPMHRVSTFSIVCYDSTTGQFGAAVQSHWFKVADVIWAEPGVGAVATQSLVDFAYGPLGLDMMRLGRTADQALAGLLASDPNNDVRQVAMVDRFGNVAAHTGEHCIAEAGHHKGINYSCQANLMRNNTVWDAMAKAFENTDGDLAERMMAALEAAQAEGGDIRGMQSAAMVVVTGKPTGQSWRDRLVDIRVDDSPQPLKELRRLLNITRAYDWMNKGDDFMTAEKFDKAAEAYAKAASLAPHNPEIRFWQAVTLVTVGKVDESLPIFKEVFAKDDSWRVLVPRLVKSNLLPDDKAIIEKIVAQ